MSGSVEPGVSAHAEDGLAAHVHDGQADGHQAKNCGDDDGFGAEAFVQTSADPRKYGRCQHADDTEDADPGDFPVQHQPRIDAAEAVEPVQRVAV